MFPMCSMFDVHCCLSCTVKRTRETNTENLFHQMHGDEAITTVTKTNFIEVLRTS